VRLRPESRLRTCRRDGEGGGYVSYFLPGCPIPPSPSPGVPPPLGTPLRDRGWQALSVSRRGDHILVIFGRGASLDVPLLVAVVVSVSRDGCIVDYSRLPIDVAWGRATLNPTAVAQSKVLAEPVHCGPNQ